MRRDPLQSANGSSSGSSASDGCSWSPQPRIHRRVHAECLVLLSHARRNVEFGSWVCLAFVAFYHRKSEKIVKTWSCDEGLNVN
jgi:hypothetical protein